MRSLIYCVGIILTGMSLYCAADSVSQQNPQTAAEQVDQLKAPLYNPFLERYVLDELKQLRRDMADQKVELTERLVDRDLSIGDRALSYSSNTVTYFFYLIAAMSSVMVIVGWTSIRDVRDKMHHVAEQEIQKLVEAYEKRLHLIEAQLTQKTQHIDENRVEIERTQEIHGLWLRAAQEHGISSKIAVYDEILKLRPTDCEALTYKADAVLELGEPQWARNLCAQALQVDSEYVHAIYQMACANVALGHFDEAIIGLSKAIQLNEMVLSDIQQDNALETLRARPEFQTLLNQNVEPTNS